MLAPFRVTLHWLNREWRKLFVTPVWSEKSSSFPEAYNNLHRSYFLISRSIYVSLSPGIKNSRSFPSAGQWFIRVLYRPEHIRLYRPVCKDVKLAINLRYLRRRGRYDGLLCSH